MDDAGYIETYSHNGEIAVMVYFTCRDPYALRTAEFKDVAKGIALNIVANAPIVIATSDLNAEASSAALERRFGSDIARGKDAVKDIRDTLKTSMCLLEQPYVKEPDKTVAEILGQLNNILGVEVNIAKFERWDTDAT